MVAMKTFLFGLKSSSRHCDFDQKITVADHVSHSRCFFHENLPFGVTEMTATCRQFLVQTLNDRSYRLSSCKRAHARKERSFPRGRTSPYTCNRYVCINTAVELDRPWRMSFTLDSYLFALSMNAFATRTPSLVTIQACVHSCSNLY